MFRSQQGAVPYSLQQSITRSYFCIASFTTMFLIVIRDYPNRMVFMAIIADYYTIVRHAKLTGHKKECIPKRWKAQKNPL